MRCDTSPSAADSKSDQFQSLLGFLMRCDCVCFVSARAVLQVSIPAGFSDALRPEKGFVIVSQVMRFNPCWVF